MVIMKKDREITPEIYDLATKLLTTDAINEILELSKQYFIKKYEIKVKKRLHVLLEYETPTNSLNAKPLLDYAAIDLFKLSSRSRTVVETAAASIDYLCGFLLQEYKILRNDLPMGGVLNKLQSNKILDSKLINNLLIFNKIVYVPAKHDFSELSDKSHRFSVPDSICILFIVSSLTRILSSKFKQRYEGWNNNDFVGKKL